MRAIPFSVGVLTLSFSAAGCSDAKVVASAFEKVCKANCECPESESYYSYGWNDVANCKKWCSGQAKVLEAELADREEDACGDINKIAKDLKDCAKKSCGEDRYACLDKHGQELGECWPSEYEYDDYYGGEGDVPNDAQPIARELQEQLLYGPFAGE